MSKRSLQAIAVVVALSVMVLIPVGLNLLRGALAEFHVELTPAEISIGGPNAASGTEIVHLSLKNHSNRDVVLMSVRTSCTCVSSEPIEDVTIPAQSEKNLEFRVNLPESGTTSSEIFCHMNVDPKPLRSRIFASGRKKLPLVKAIRNGSPTYLALATVAEPAKTVLIETRETKGTTPWVTSLVCDLPEVEIQPKGVREKGHVDDDFLDRTYPFELTWKEIPASPEFAGKLTATTSEGGQISVGHLRGSRLSEVTFSPSIARLTPDRRSETVFIAPASQVWSLASDEDCPDWMSAEFVASNRGACVKLSVRKGAVPASQTFNLRIRSEHDLHAELPVAVEGFVAQ